MKLKKEQHEQYLKYLGYKLRDFPRVYRASELPLPIPNRVVKTRTADGNTALCRVKVGHCGDYHQASGYAGGFLF